MIVTLDTRSSRRAAPVMIRMTEDEFTETVEWLELLSPDDGCTRHWREAHDRIFPPSDGALDASQASRPSPST